MKTLVQALYNYKFVGTVTEDISHEEDEMEIAVSESQPPHGDRQLVSYPNSESNWVNLFGLSIKIKRKIPVK